MAGNVLLDKVALDKTNLSRVESLRDLIGLPDRGIAMLYRLVVRRLEGHTGYQAIHAIPGVGKILAAVFVAEVGDISRVGRPPAAGPVGGRDPRHHESDATVRRSSPIGPPTAGLDRPPGLWLPAAMGSLRRRPAHLRVVRRQPPPGATVLALRADAS
jgi:transposase